MAYEAGNQLIPRPIQDAQNNQLTVYKYMYIYTHVVKATADQPLGICKLGSQNRTVNGQAQAPFIGLSKPGLIALQGGGPGGSTTVA